MAESTSQRQNDAVTIVGGGYAGAASVSLTCITALLGCYFFPIVPTPTGLALISLGFSPHSMCRALRELVLAHLGV